MQPVWKETYIFLVLIISQLWYNYSSAIFRQNIFMQLISASIQIRILFSSNLSVCSEPIDINSLTELNPRIVCRSTYINSNPVNHDLQQRITSIVIILVKLELLLSNKRMKTIYLKQFSALAFIRIACIGLDKKIHVTCYYSVH